MYQRLTIITHEDLLSRDLDIEKSLLEAVSYVHPPTAEALLSVDSRKSP